MDQVSHYFQDFDLGPRILLTFIEPLLPYIVLSSLYVLTCFSGTLSGSYNFVIPIL